jgi:hypothetical protein
MRVSSRVARELVARALGAYRLKDLDRPEHLFQLVIADLPVDFPPLDTESSPLPDAASHRPAMGRQRPLRAYRGGDRVARTREHNDERITLG